jgi:hypothetical protein
MFFKDWLIDILIVNNDQPTIVDHDFQDLFLGSSIVILVINGRPTMVDHVFF